MTSLPHHIDIDHISDPILDEQDISLSVLRLDKIHPEVSGNKFFKLYYYIEECMASTHKTLLTFGGAYSNHLAATAFFCREKGIKAIGIVRGEEPAILSQTLKQCREQGMQLQFIPREEYQKSRNEDLQKQLKNLYGDCTIVPEGGFGPEGAAGASLIMELIQKEKTEYICTAVGTATTLAGLLMKKNPEQKIIAIPVIKNMHDIPSRIEELTGGRENMPVVFDEYHFGGYAKYTGAITGFMNEFYTKHHIPLDFVYTGKLMFGITDQIKKGYFKRGSRILCLHTGGLQGNISLPKGTLIF